MKQGTLVMRIIVLVLFFGVAAYFGVYLWNTLTNETATATVYTYTAEDRVESSGYFFRDETVLTETSALAEVLADEGERVGLGDPVVRIYSSTEGYQLQQQLDEATASLENLQYILSRTSESADTMAMDDDIIAAFTGIRASVAAENLTGLDEATGELKTLVFRRDYTYNGTDTLNAQIDEAQALVDTLSAQSSGAYETVLAPVSGLYSASMDGYEGVMTTAALEGLTPQGLTALAGQDQTPPENSIGKIITGNSWYFACNVPSDQTGSLYAGAAVKLRFSDSSRDFDVKVQSVSDEENGLVTVVFSSANFGTLVTAMRSQSVNIITGSATGFRVPKRALRVAEDGTLGVYRISGAQASWISVEVLWEEDDYYLVKQATVYDEDGQVAQQSDFEKASALRVGDTIIVKGEAVYDGKVVTD